MLGTVVVPVFNLPSPVIEPRLAWLVIASYSLQLFFDFSGYVDMAIGIGQMMGVRLMENFNAPYLSLSIGEFWRPLAHIAFHLVQGDRVLPSGKAQDWAVWPAGQYPGCFHPHGFVARIDPQLPALGDMARRGARI